MIISFIGGGNMANALIGGLLDAPEPPEIRVADTSASARERLGRLPGVTVFSESLEATQDATMVVLALKPQVLPAVMETLGPQLRPGQCVVSVAAGITTERLGRGLAEGVSVIRTMPNTPALLGLGITGMYAAKGCSEAQKAAAEQLMGSAGETLWVEQEELLDAVTAVSGSGPAYFYLFSEALAEAGAALGLPGDTARKLAEQTAYGAGAMLAQSGDDAPTLRKKVTSPGGTTAAAIDSFEAGGLRELVRVAATAAAQRSRELACAGDDA